MVSCLDSSPSPIYGTVADVIQSVRPMFPESDVAAAVRYLQQSGKKIDISSLIDAVYLIQERRLRDTPPQQQQSPTAIHQRLTGKMDSHYSSELISKNCSEVGDEELSSSESEIGESQAPISADETREKTRRLKLFYEDKIRSLRSMCQICRTERANILLLPCAHVSCCGYCLRDMRRCPVPSCGKIVRGTKQVFFN